MSVSDALLVEKYGPYALITGASSGIGATFADTLASRGLNLILVARREERLREAADRLTSKHGIRVRYVVADLASSDGCAQVIDATSDVQIGLLINNAGSATTGAFHDVDPQKHVDAIALAVSTPTVLTHHYGGLMKSRGNGGVIFLSSTASFGGLPLWTMYAAGKAYQRVFVEGLALELGAAGVDVLAVCPGLTRTEFFEQSNTNFEGMLFSTPEKVVDVALAKLGRRPVVIPSWWDRYSVWALGVLPDSLRSAVAWSMMKRAVR
jgi:uncharacterized protein